MVFMDWILGATLLCFISYITLTATDGGKRIFKKSKILD